MAVTKVGGAAAAVSASQQATFQLTFTADTTFAENDIIVAHVSGHDSSGTFSAPSGTTWVDMLSIGLPIGWQYHVVTGAEAGSASLAYTWTISVHSWWYGYGVVFRPDSGQGLDPATPSGIDVGGPVAGTSPRTTVLLANDFTGLMDAADYHIGMRAVFTNMGAGKTAHDTAWPASTDMNDAVDSWVSVRYFAGAYQIAPQGTLVMAAESAVTTWSGGGSTLGSVPGTSVFFVITGVIPPTETSFPSPYEPISRRIDIGELPHEVSSPMFDDL